MAAPRYNGGPQSVPGHGDWLGRVGTFFGVGATPAYAGNGQPSARARTLGSSAPVYQTKPRCASTVDAPVDPASVVCPIDPAALAEGQIAIVIPRKGC